MSFDILIQGDTISLFHTPSHHCKFHPQGMHELACNIFLVFREESRALLEQQAQLFPDLATSRPTATSDPTATSRPTATSNPAAPNSKTVMGTPQKYDDSDTSRDTPQKPEDTGGNATPARSDSSGAKAAQRKGTDSVQTPVVGRVVYEWDDRIFGLVLRWIRIRWSKQS